jgi:hypothetical protein
MYGALAVNLAGALAAFLVAALRTSRRDAGLRSKCSYTALVEREVFARRLHEAATVGRDFARKYIREPLPDPMLFRLRLNSSYDGNPRIGDEVVFPEDGSAERAEALQLCNEQQVVNELWRDGRVPEWIDVAVIGETGTATLLQLRCCGRFTADDGLLYHAHEGRQPFHVTGPTLPVHYEDGQTFSIYNRSECWTLGDVDHLRDHARNVWSLDLFGRDFDDEALGKLPDLSHMELLLLHASSISGSGLSVLSRFPKLRVLRISLARNESFQIPRLPAKLLGLEVFDISDPPVRPWGFSDFASNAPVVNWLTFKSRGALFVDGDCPRATQNLSISATRITAGVRLPKAIESVYAHLSEMGDSEIDHWLGTAEQIGGLDLSGTPITDAFAETLPKRFGLRYLNVVRTNVSEAAVRRISSSYPKLKLLPNLKPPQRT